MRRNKKRRNGLRLIGLMVMIICFVVLYKSTELKSEANAKVQKKAELEQLISDENDRTKEIEERKLYPGTKKYIEDVARSQLGLVYPDEIIFEPEKENKK
ncbi:FtsB family cell division protein [Lachnoclostridium phytofermentans]|nr:septum formation initiator family protein [Lachnoclostridium phytofermentans]